MTAQKPKANSLKLSPPKTEFEQDSYQRLTRYEQRAAALPVAGIDEAGRGPLAGPVVAAACILPEGCYLPGLDDSKKLTERRREQLFSVLTEDPRVRYGVGVADAPLIDTVNIFQATIQAMLMAVDELVVQPGYLLVDGLKLPHPTIPGEKIIKGDNLSLSIMAAAIIAKVTRDRLMKAYDQQWPQYGFAKHKGYGTQAHRDAIAEHGPCDIHRKTFEPIKSMLANSASLC